MSKELKALARAILKKPMIRDHDVIKLCQLVEALPGARRDRQQDRVDG